MKLLRFEVSHDNKLTIECELPENRMDANLLLQLNDRFYRNRIYNSIRKVSNQRRNQTLCGFLCEMMPLFTPAELSRLLTAATAARLNPK